MQRFVYRKNLGISINILVHTPALNDWNDVLVDYRRNAAVLEKQMQPARLQQKVRQYGGPSL